MSDKMDEGESSLKNKNFGEFHSLEEFTKVKLNFHAFNIKKIV